MKRMRPGRANSTARVGQARTGRPPCSTSVTVGARTLPGAGPRCRHGGPDPRGGANGASRRKGRGRSGASVRPSCRHSPRRALAQVLLT